MYAIDGHTVCTIRCTDYIITWTRAIGSTFIKILSRKLMYPTCYMYIVDIHIITFHSYTSTCVIHMHNVLYYTGHLHVYVYCHSHKHT